MKQTVCIDDIECPYCGCKFDGQKAINNNLDCMSVDCPECGREMDIMVSVEYTATEIED